MYTSITPNDVLHLFRAIFQMIFARKNSAFFYNLSSHYFLYVRLNNR